MICNSRSIVQAYPACVEKCAHKPAPQIGRESVVLQLQAVRLVRLQALTCLFARSQATCFLTLRLDENIQDNADLRKIYKTMQTCAKLRKIYKTMQTCAKSRKIYKTMQTCAKLLACQLDSGRSVSALISQTKPFDAQLCSQSLIAHLAGFALAVYGRDLPLTRWPYRLGTTPK